jgi:hypothetical protein
VELAYHIIASALSFGLGWSLRAARKPQLPPPPVEVPVAQAKAVRRDRAGNIGPGRARLRELLIQRELLRRDTPTGGADE